MAAGEVPIVVANSVTKLGPETRDAVLIGGSHGGVYAGYLAANEGARAVILNDAGVGKDEAGVGSLAYLDKLGIPAATVDHRSARIGDGKDMASRGRISRVNQAAQTLGCSPGMTASQCAERMRKAKPYRGEAPSYAEARFCFRKEPGEPEVWGIDSASLVRPEDAGQIVITASHGALLAGETASAIKYDVLACAFNDAGFGADDIGASRLPALDQRGIAAVVLDCMTARIGDARSAWETGKVSRANATATKLGVKPGMTTQQFAEAAIRAKKK
jgi:uncharacterized protein YunC (DUF1805 family)